MSGLGFLLCIFFLEFCLFDQVALDLDGWEEGGMLACVVGER